MYKFTEYHSDKTRLSSTGTLLEATHKYKDCAGMGISCSIIKLDENHEAIDVIDFYEDDLMDNSWWMDNLL